MKVTDLQLAMEPALIKKLDLMTKRCEQQKPEWDSLLLVEGGEGDGKTTCGANCGYYIHHETGRPFGNQNIFFDVGSMIKFAQNTTKQIIMWDEPALEGLSAEWWRQTQRDLIKLLMMCRKNRHFFIFNITRFNKFSEYIVVDRAMGMIHVYSRRQMEPGRFVYIRKKYLEYLYNDYRTSKRRNYKKYASIRGTFPDALHKIIDMKEYNERKDKAIMSIGTKKESLEKNKLNNLQKRIGLIKFPIKTQTEFAGKLHIDRKTLSNWGRKEGKVPDKGDTPSFEAGKGSNI